ncbi:hypothetical protein O3P69_016686 [Scylla paramamosain]|uniref:Uncharacterized protein n=1 Tax=Scylla paramamosain TaxID=85552 RepID=A0AAW0SZ51_SCYPA
MAGRPRFHTTTSRAPRTPGVPSSHLATTLEMQQALMAMQQALARRSPASRVPTSATPEKWTPTLAGVLRGEVAGAELDAPLPDVAQEVVAGAHRHPAPASVRTRPPANRPHTPRREALWQLWSTHAPGSTLPRQVAELLQMWETRTCRENVSQRREEINDPRLGGGCLGPPADVWGRAGGWHRSVPPPDAPRLRHQWGACNVRVMAVADTGAQPGVTTRWTSTGDGPSDVRELAMARSGDERVERQGPVRTLEPLSPGSRVWVQNQMTKVWDRSGVVAEALPHRQYTVRLDGSGRLSLRNRRHLRVKRGATLASPAPSHAGPTPATSPTPQPRQSTPSRPRRTSRRPQWLADYDESSPP